MKNKKLLSFIVTAHNDENYIQRCLNSLISQTRLYKDKIEIIISINNSTDKTQEIVEAMLVENDNLKVVLSKTPGPSVARNFGIEKAEGEYLTFIDGDDYVNENIKTIIDVIEKNKEVDFFANTYVINKNATHFRQPTL